MCAFKVIGMASVLRAIDKLERDVEREVNAELKRIADEILADAVSRVHVISGELKASAYVTPYENGYAVGFSASYSAYEEFGTGGLVNVTGGYEEFALEFKVPGRRKRDGEPHPYLFPAFLARRDEIAKELEKKLNEYIKSK